MRLGASTRKYNTGNKTLVGQSARRQVFMRWKEVRAFLIPSATKRNLWQSWDPRKQTVLNFINYLKFYWEFKGYNYYGIDIYCQHLLIILLAFELRERNLTAIVNPHSITALRAFKTFCGKSKELKCPYKWLDLRRNPAESTFKVSGNIKSLRRNPNPSSCSFPLHQGGCGGKIPRELFMFKGARYRERGSVRERSAPSHLPLSVSVRFFS